MCMGLSVSSRLIVLVEVARVVEEEEEEEKEEIGSSEVGLSGKASLSEKVVLVLLTVEVGAVKEGSGFRPSRRVFGRAITACAIKRVPSRQVRVGQVWGSLHGRVSLGSLRALQVGLVSRSVGRVAVRCRRRVGLTKLWR